MAEDMFSQEQEAFFEWLEERDMDSSLADLIGDHPEWTEPLEFEAQDLERLEVLAHDYLQSLADRDALPDAPELDIETPLLEQTRDHDLDFDH